VLQSEWQLNQYGIFQAVAKGLSTTVVGAIIGVFELVVVLLAPIYGKYVRIAFFAGTSYDPVSVCRSVCVSLSQGVLSKQMNESSWFLAWELLSTRLTHCVKRKFRYLQNKDTFLWNFVPNLGLLKFCLGISIVETLEKSGRSERDKLDHRRSTKLTIPSSSDARPLAITVIIKLCLQHTFVARVN